MLFSIIIPVRNNLNFTIPCLNSLFSFTKDFQLIIVDDNSTDDTPAFLHAFAASHPNSKIITMPQHSGFAPSVNAGIELATAPYIIILNNDTLLTPNWANQLVAAIPLAEKQFDCAPIGIIGPRTNAAGGGQSVPFDNYSPDQLPQAAQQFHQQYKDSTSLTGFVSGFCMLITRACLEATGPFDTRFKIGGVEDTELCLRAQLQGFKLAWDNSTYIHHFGNATLSQLTQPYQPILAANRLQFLNKYYSDTPKKLIATIRVRDQLDHLKQSLPRTAQFSDDIIVLCDRTTQYPPQSLKSFPKVSQVIEVNDGWDLYRDRTILMQAAKRHKAHWIFALDADEILEDSFTYTKSHSLISPLNPQTLAYSFDFCTFFLGNTHFRTDGIFGAMRGTRLFRSLPNQHPRMIRGNRRCCLHIPSLSSFNTVHLRTRVKHFGYQDDSTCQNKFDFYSKLDPKPDPGYIGPQGYNHLISKSLVLSKWQEKNDITLAIIAKNEEVNLFTLLHSIHPYFDDILVVDTGSNDNTKKVANLFTDHIATIPWKNDFSAARNFAMSQCTTTWILFLDPDEQLDTSHIPLLYNLLNTEAHAFLFKVINFQPDGSSVLSDNTRLLRNDPRIRWSGLVHEKIAPSVRKHNLTVLPSPIPINHYGFLKSDNIKSAKTKLYTRLLKKMARQPNPEPSTFFHLAFAYFDKGNDTKGLALLQKTLDLQPDFFLASKELGLIHLTKAQQYLQQLSTSIPQKHYFHSWASRTLAAVNQALNVPL